MNWFKKLFGKTPKPSEKKVQTPISVSKYQDTKTPDNPPVNKYRDKDDDLLNPTNLLSPLNPFSISNMDNNDTPSSIPYHDTNTNHSSTYDSGSSWSSSDSSTYDSGSSWSSSDSSTYDSGSSWSSSDSSSYSSGSSDW